MKVDKEETTMSQRSEFHNLDNPVDGSGVYVAGTEHFAGQRLGCWINTIPANGLVMIPEASAGCVLIRSSILGKKDSMVFYFIRWSFNGYGKRV